MFFDEKTGALAFENGLRLLPYMKGKDLLAALGEAGMSPHGPEDPGMAPLPPCPTAGGALAPVCHLLEDKLAAVTLTVAAAGPKAALTAEQQRAFLFAAFQARDPCPDTQRNCVLRCACGAVTLCTDPRSGQALARVEYS